MRPPLFHIFRLALLVCLSVVVTFPQTLFAQDHVVSTDDVQKTLQDAAATLQHEIAQIDKFFSSEAAHKALQSAHLDYRQVEKGVRQLSDDELARISARTAQAQRDFAAGSMSNRDLIWILIIIAVVILIIVAVR